MMRNYSLADVSLAVCADGLPILVLVAFFDVLLIGDFWCYGMLERRSEGGY